MKDFKKIIIAGLLVVAGLVGVPPVLAQTPGNNNAEQQPDFVPGELLVKFSPGLSGQDITRRVAEVRGRPADTLPAIGVVRIKVPPGQELASLARLQNRPGIEHVEPNYIAYAQEIPDDPAFNIQWGLSTIGLPDVLDITLGSSDVLVAVVDTGVDLDHPDFLCAIDGGQSKLVAGVTFVSGSSTPDNYTPDDDNSHGTHAAGIVGACTNNGTGVAGVAPNSRLMPVKVLDSTGIGSYTGVANGIIYAVNNGADIVNLSLGGTMDSVTLYDAVRYAYDNGVLVVAASGNYGTSSILYPAAYSEVMAVGATTSSDIRASFSNYGSGLSVVAPGSSIYITCNNGGYNYKSGTSIATPFVAGLAAVVWGVEPNLAHSEVQYLIESTSVDLGPAGWDPYYGSGRIDAFAAIEALLVNQFQLPLSANPISPVVFLTDDQTEPGTRTIELPTINVDWTASVSPGVSWVEVVTPEASGLTGETASNVLILSASRPDSHGQYTTGLVITGTTSSAQHIGPITYDDIVRISYVEQLHRVRLPVIMRN